jgi:peroxisomal 2,4-dienoyl-CoA reductase
MNYFKVMFEPNLLTGKAGIITGGSSGIGFEVARYLLSLGAKMTITGRHREKLEQAQQKLGKECAIAVGDVRKQEDVLKNFEAHMKRFDRVDFLINNAAGNFLCPLETMSENAFRAVNEIVCLGTFLWSKAVLKQMREQNGGRILNIGTNYAFGQGAFVAHSGAAKAAVLNLTKSMAIEWADYGIRVNMICPGPIEGTEGVSRLMGPFKDEYLQLLPVKRLGKGEEIGAAAAFLLSGVGDYITGTVIPIDGGMHLLHPGLIPPQFFDRVKSATGNGMVGKVMKKLGHVFGK